MQRRQTGTARGGKTGPRGRERLADKMKRGGIKALEGRAFSRNSQRECTKRIVERVFVRSLGGAQDDWEWAGCLQSC
ncbi:hypothetical protein TH61_08630 [Rufibacter sp. DG15C]|nr:hypothetical protein TH61_08630 [Rufibacter sp. DG15C]